MPVTHSLSAPNPRQPGSMSLEEVIFNRRIASGSGDSIPTIKLPPEGRARKLSRAATTANLSKRRLASSSRATLRPITVAHPPTSHSVTSPPTFGPTPRLTDRRPGVVPGPTQAIVDKAELLEITDKCNRLAETVFRLETELERYREMATSRHPQSQEHSTEKGGGVPKAGLYTSELLEDGSQPSANNNSHPVTPPAQVVGRSVKEGLVKGVGQLGAHLSSLHDVFFASAQQARLWESSAVTIQSAVRRGITRLRYLRMRGAMLGLQLLYSRPLAGAAEAHVRRQAQITVKVRELRVMRDMQVMQVVFTAWEMERRNGLDLKRRRKAEALRLERECNHRWMRSVVHAWNLIVTGPSSRKACRLRHARRVGEARKALLDRMGGDGSGVLTNDMVLKEVKRRVHDDLLKQQRFHCLKKHLAALREAVVMAHRRWKLAVEHHRMSVLSEIFYPWTEWTYTHGKGLDRKQWKGPRRFEIPYNRKLVEGFIRRRVMRLFFPAWRAVAHRYAEATRRHRRVMTVFARAHVHAWRSVTTHQRVLRVNTVQRWKQRQRDIIARPFQAWYLYVDSKMREKEDEDRLIAQHHRLKTRKLLWRIMRTWRHQAVFGRVEGLYSRTELMRSLAEQKLHAQALERQSREFAATLEESGRIVQVSSTTVKQLQAKLEGRESEIENLKMALHNAEQEMVQMRASLDSVAKLYPTIVDHLSGLQGEFGFADRKLAPLARQRKEDETVREAKARATEATLWLKDHEEEVEAVRGAVVELEGMKDELSAEELAVFERADECERDVKAYAAMVDRLESGAGASDQQQPAPKRGLRESDQSLSSTQQSSSSNNNNNSSSTDDSRRRTVKDQGESCVQLSGVEVKALKRLQFCLRYTDLSSLIQAKPRGEGETEFDVLQGKLAAMQGLWEFLRTGNSEALGEERRELWEFSESPRAAATVEGEESESGGVAGREWNQLLEAGTAGRMTWNDLMIHMNAKMPARRKNQTVHETLSKRYLRDDERLERTMEGLYGPDSTTFAVNPYSLQPVDDDFKPGTPREWDVYGDTDDGISFPPPNLGSPLALTFGTLAGDLPS